MKAMTDPLLSTSMGSLSSGGRRIAQPRSGKENTGYR
jgi:hypothetical protein